MLRSGIELWQQIQTCPKPVVLSYHCVHHDYGYDYYFLCSPRSPSKPLARKLMGVTDWEAVSRNSVSEERLETRSLPTRSPPGTPNQ